jgi:hypothetical protein
VTMTPTATPAPVTYKVAKNDDMGGIAFRFGVSPKALMTANPSVNPRAMGVGTLLIIPITLTPGSKTDSSSPTSGPQSLPTDSLIITSRTPDCYPADDGGAWCFWLVQSGASQGVENVAGEISLAQVGGPPITQTAAAPLDIFPAGSTLPLVAYFPAPIPAKLTATGQIKGFLPLAKGNGRYLPVEIHDSQTSLDASLGNAIVTGTVNLPVGSQTANTLRLAATAFDSDGAVVGLRIWEAPGPLTQGQSLPFQIRVDSLGKSISRVTLLAEARP